MIVAAIIFLCFFIPAFGQDSQWVPGNNFDFAVSLQYDVEPDVIGAGVAGGMTNWTGNPDDISTNQYQQPPPVWTNYDREGLPSEIFQTPPEVHASDPLDDPSQFGFAGIGPILDANTNASQAYTTAISVPLPYISGNQFSASQFQSVTVLPVPRPGNPISGPSIIQKIFGMDEWDQNVDETYKRIGWQFCVGFYNVLLKFFSFSLEIRNFISSLCTAVALLHFAWATAILGSGVFRAIVAGVTGISGGK